MRIKDEFDPALHELQIWAIMCFMSGLTGLALVLDLGVSLHCSLQPVWLLGSLPFQ